MALTYINVFQDTCLTLFSKKRKIWRKYSYNINKHNSLYVSKPSETELKQSWNRGETEGCVWLETRDFAEVSSLHLLLESKLHSNWEFLDLWQEIKSEAWKTGFARISGFIRSMLRLLALFAVCLSLHRRCFRILANRAKHRREVNGILDTL